MVTDQEQRVLGSIRAEPAALLPSPNVLTTCTDERRMAFLNTALLVRILPSPRCCRLGDDDELSSRDGKLHLSRDRTRSYHVLLIQDPLHVQGPFQSHRPSDRGTASLWPSHLSLVTHLSLVVTLSHLSLVVTSADVPSRGTSTQLTPLCPTLVLVATVPLLSRCVVSLSHLVVVSLSCLVVLSRSYVNVSCRVLSSQSRARLTMF